MSLPVQSFDCAEIEAGARHFGRVADGMPGVGKKAARRAERAEAVAAVDADDARIRDALNRIDGANSFARALAPARRVQGRAVPDMLPARDMARFTAADVADLEARVRADEAAQRPAAPLNTRSHTVMLPYQRRNDGFVIR